MINKLVRDLAFDFDFIPRYQCVPQILFSVNTGVLTR